MWDRIEQWAFAHRRRRLHRFAWGMAYGGPLSSALCWWFLRHRRPWHWLLLCNGLGPGPCPHERNLSVAP